MIRFSLIGVGQPKVSILINKDILFEGIIDGLHELDCPVELKDGDVVTVVGINKRNGEDGVWDTIVDSNGNIISDKYLVINNIMINNISMGREWISSINSLGNFESNSIYKNGELKFIAQEPLLNWIIEQKYINKKSDVVDSYSGAGKFDYEYIRNRIDAIKQLLDD